MLVFRDDPGVVGLLASGWWSLFGDTGDGGVELVFHVVEVVDGVDFVEVEEDGVEFLHGFAEF